MKETSDSAPATLEWLGFTRNPKLSQAPRLGRMLGLMMMFTILAAIILAVVLFGQFFATALRIDQGTNVRDIGLAFAAVLGAPFIIWRTSIAAAQARTAQEGLITDRINTAVQNLGAEKERHDGEGGVTHVPNLEVRIGAIYALERIARNTLDVHIQVMETLCAYIRENAKAEDAEEHPRQKVWGFVDAHNVDHHMAWQAALEHFGFSDDDVSVSSIKAWANSLQPPRTDVQTALEVLGRRSPAQIARERAANVRGSNVRYRLDLRRTNLQRADLGDLALAHALLTGARMEGAALGEARLERAYLFEARMEGAYLGEARLERAYLFEARMEGAYLGEARLEGAYFREARMEGANLSRARLEGANLGEARMEGANLSEARMERAYLRYARLEGADLRYARMDAGTNFNAAVVQYAAVKSVSLESIVLDQDVVNAIFGDGSVTLPPGLTRPDHWPEGDLHWAFFLEKWRTWQRENGYTPPE